MEIHLLLEIPLSVELSEQLRLVEADLKILVTKEPQGSYFKYDSQGLSLIDEEMGALHLDFIKDVQSYSRTSHRGKSELIAKAIGLAKGTRKVFDATLGLAQDAWFLSQLGAEVEGCERSPVVYLLLADALIRSKQSRLKIHYGDSIQWLQKEGPSGTAVYLDPMFPEKKKSALPRKEMRIFRKWVGEDKDSLDLFEAAMSSLAERVVVKRPMKAPDLAPGVVHSFKGQTVRYDLYSPSKGKG